MLLCRQHSERLPRHFSDLELGHLSPPVGFEPLEEFMDERWGDRQPRTYSKNLSIVVDFVDWAVARGKLTGNPARGLPRPRRRGVYRTTVTREHELAIVASQPE